MGRTIRVLLVDDEEDFVMPVSYWLQSRGYETATVANGQEALDAIEKQMPDIVFMDINMPVMDGLETLRRIRELYKGLPVIMVTAAYQDEKNFEKANKLGISGFFPKHSSLPELGRIIEASLRAHTKLRPETKE